MLSVKRLVKKNIKAKNNRIVKKNVLDVDNDLSSQHFFVDNDNVFEETKEEKETVVVEKKVKNNRKKNKKDMQNITEEQISKAENVATSLNDTKVIKKERGLIERTESSKIILTEDNRQLLND